MFIYSLGGESTSSLFTVAPFHPPPTQSIAHHGSGSRRLSGASQSQPTGHTMAQPKSTSSQPTPTGVCVLALFSNLNVAQEKYEKLRNEIIIMCPA